MKPYRHPSPARLKSLLNRFAGRRILVAGDVILDEYLFGDAKRISPEAPIPVVELKEETITPGAAAYVAAHVRHLGGEPVLCGVVGEDADGERIRSLLGDRGIKAEGLVGDDDRPTIVKTRVIARNQQMLRIDRERLAPVSAAITRRLLDFITASLNNVDGLIFSDYDKGTLTPPLIAAVIRAARRAGIPVAVNPKPRLALKFRGAAVVSMNLEEAQACLNRILPDERALAAGGAELRRRLKARAVLITRHSRGMGLFTRNGAGFIPSRAREVFDGTGAGDTVIAVAGVGLAAGGRMTDCVHLANAAAAIEVGKLGCALVSPAEIRREL
jgi:D-beta-D-heptose 7-phosphate kinase/D-beta-D-heptose 1-phosphate adenosyltransferase